MYYFSDEYNDKCQSIMSGCNETNFEGYCAAVDKQDDMELDEVTTKEQELISLYHCSIFLQSLIKMGVEGWEHFNEAKADYEEKIVGAMKEENV